MLNQWPCFQLASPSLYFPKRKSVFSGLNICFLSNTSSVQSVKLLILPNLLASSITRCRQSSNLRDVRSLVQVQHLKQGGLTRTLYFTKRKASTDGQIFQRHLKHHFGVMKKFYQRDNLVRNSSLLVVVVVVCCCCC